MGWASIRFSLKAVHILFAPRKRRVHDSTGKLKNSGLSVKLRSTEGWTALIISNSRHINYHLRYREGESERERETNYEILDSMRTRRKLKKEIVVIDLDSPVAGKPPNTVWSLSFLLCQPLICCNDCSPNLG